DRDDRHVQRAADRLDDLAHGDALLAVGVVDRVGRTLLQGEPIEADDIRSMRRGPALGKPVKSQIR
ncbi:hypothetical protein ACQR10_32605, partial [Bradyrhizobium sp. HKCCYLRH2060]|uniref:hypothetical protein n=1 Tax=Bradyrhizobium TaxID=374 RepID=UPI002917067F